MEYHYMKWILQIPIMPECLWQTTFAPPFKKSQNMSDKNKPKLSLKLHLAYLPDFFPFEPEY